MKAVPFNSKFVTTGTTRIDCRNMAALDIILISHAAGGNDLYYIYGYIGPVQWTIANGVSILPNIKHGYHFSRAQTYMTNASPAGIDAPFGDVTQFGILPERIVISTSGNVWQYALPTYDD